MPQGLYIDLYPTIVAQIKAKHQVHGSEVRDMFCTYAAGRFSTDNYAESLIVDLVHAGVLQTLQCAPTKSQGAFFGTMMLKKGQPWGPGTVEHYWYKVITDGSI